MYLPHKHYSICLILQENKYEEVVIKEEVHELEVTDTDCTVQGTVGECTTVLTCNTVKML